MSADNEYHTFTTSIASRAKSPIKFNLVGVELNDDGDPVYTNNGEPIEIIVTIRLDPKIEMLKLGRVMSEFQALGKSARKSKSIADAANVVTSDEKDAVEDIDLDRLLEDADREIIAATAATRQAFRKLIVPPDRDLWDRVAEQIDMLTIVQMVNFAMQELSGGMDPTQPVSSGTGSERTGKLSTDGAAPEESLK